VGSCEQPDLTKPVALPEAGKFPPIPCGVGVLVIGGRMKGAGLDLGKIAAAFSQRAGRPVVDKSGLQQKFDIDMELPPGGPISSPSDTGGPSIFTAIQEQLGLKLEATKGPIDALVIDQVQRPSEN
jgi:uncharacterized protein (TIGR03435 family)